MDPETIILSPHQAIRKIIEFSFNSEGKRKKKSLQVLNSILLLAQTRGFPFYNELKNSTQYEKLSETEEKRLIYKLLDYISSDELILLAQRNDLV